MTLQWTEEHISVLSLVFLLFLEKYWEVDLLDNMVVLVFSFWGKPHCLHSGCTDIHFYQHRTRVSFSLHPPQHFLLVALLIRATWQVWGSTSLWSWFSNPWWDVEHVFICLLAICIYSLQKCLFVLCPILKSGFGCFSQYILWVLELFWISTSFPMCITCSYLLPLSRLPFSFVMVSLDV